jgi:hypothetical protein
MSHRRREMRDPQGGKKNYSRAGLRVSSDLPAISGFTMAGGKSSKQETPKSNRSVAFSSFAIASYPKNQNCSDKQKSASMVNF